MPEFKLMWTNTAKLEQKKRLPYTGNSTTTHYRKYGPKGKFIVAAKETNSLTNFFKPVKSLIEDELIIDLMDNQNEQNEPDAVTVSDDNGVSANINNSDYWDIIEIDSLNQFNLINEDTVLEKEGTDDEMNNEVASEEESTVDKTQSINDDDFDLKLQKLERVISDNQKIQTVYNYLRYRSIHEYFKYWKKDGLTRIKASEKASKEVYNKGVYRSRVIRKLGNYWLEYGSLPISLQGCHQKTKSFIDDKDVINCSLAYIRTNVGKTTSREYKEFVMSKLFSQMGIMATYKSISIKTARTWLCKLGLSRKKGIYFDEHEHEDVLQY